MTLEKPFHIYILIFFLFFVTIEQASAQRLPVPRELGQGEVADAGELFGDVWTGYKVEQHMVPMRDGVRLNTFLLYPEKRETPLPIMYLRSPYGWRWQSFDGTVVGDIKRAAAVHELMVQDQYIFVAQDQRGRFGSEGEYEILRPFYSLTDPSKTDDITDIHDTIDWALETAKEHNGKVGISGTSYRGWNAAVALIRPHPALKASAPSAAMAEGFLGDDFYQNGAFNLAMTTPFLTQSIDGYEASPTLSDRIKSHDEYDFYLKHGTMNALRPYFPENTPITDRVLKNDRENDYWKQRKLPNAFDMPLTVPILHVISGYDSEDLPGPLALYHKLESLDKDELNHMVMGPWYHGAWRYEGADRFGPISFGMDTGKYFQEKILMPFFRAHLKNDPQEQQPEAHIFDTGTNEWRSFDAWPPASSKRQKLYLTQKKTIVTKRPSSMGTQNLQYVNDPSNPVPYFPRPNYDGFRKDYKVQDQRFAMHRPDVLTFESDVLEEDMTFAGEAIANIIASTTGSDTDWVVKVIDAYPDDAAEMKGFHRLVFSGIFRAKYRTGLNAPEAVTSNKAETYRFSLTEQLHTIKKGHRLVIQVQSTWFPLFDRNPNQFMPVHEAEIEDFEAVTQTVFTSNQKASYVEINVLQQK